MKHPEGYIFEADHICSQCVSRHYTADSNPMRNAENLLDGEAKKLGIDRFDETTFDSDTFPKVLFDVTDETCGNCQMKLTDVSTLGLVYNG